MKPVHLHIAAALAVAGLAACEPRVSVHGQVLDHQAIENLQPGVHDQAQVEEALGTPSTSTLFGDDTWFYISQRRSTSVLSLPETEEQTVVAVAFDDSGIVREIAMLTIEDGIAIDPVSRSTPTYGRELGLLEQLLGNIGRFDSTSQTNFPTP